MFWHLYGDVPIYCLILRSAGNLLRTSAIAYVLSKTAYVLSKTAYVLSKTAYVLSKTAYVLSKIAYVLSKIAYVLSKIAYVQVIVNQAVYQNIPTEIICPAGNNKFIRCRVFSCFVLKHSGWFIYVSTSKAFPLYGILTAVKLCRMVFLSLAGVAVTNYQ